ncbi:MAG: hypothetical protein J4A00_08780 [Gammaproteobacteria bacterium]|nr:hypothetical protein [Gammaproteobacteria bacterium]
MIAGALLGWQWSDYQAEVRLQAFGSLQRDLRDATAQIALLDATNARLESRAQVDRSAYEALQTQLEELMQVQHEFRRELRIYQELMAVTHKGARVHSFTARGGADGRYGYQLVLSQGVAAKGPVSGVVSLINPSDGAEPLAEVPFDFRYLQFIEGQVDLPIEGVPESLLLRLESKSGEVVEQIVSWPEGRPIGRVSDVE